MYLEEPLPIYCVNFVIFDLVVGNEKMLACLYVRKKKEEEDGDRNIEINFRFFCKIEF